MKEKFKTIAIIILLIISLFLIIGCGTGKDLLVLPGHNAKHQADHHDQSASIRHNKHHITIEITWLARKG